MYVICLSWGSIMCFTVHIELSKPQHDGDIITSGETWQRKLPTVEVPYSWGTTWLAKTRGDSLRGLRCNPRTIGMSSIFIFLHDLLHFVCSSFVDPLAFFFLCNALHSSSISLSLLEVLVLLISTTLHSLSSSSSIKLNKFTLGGTWGTCVCW